MWAYLLNWPGSWMAITRRRRRTVNVAKRICITNLREQGGNGNSKQDYEDGPSLLLQFHLCGRKTKSTVVVHNSWSSCCWCSGLYTNLPHHYMNPNAELCNAAGRVRYPSEWIDWLTQWLDKDERRAATENRGDSVGHLPRSPRPTEVHENVMH